MSVTVRHDAKSRAGALFRSFQVFRGFLPGIERDKISPHPVAQSLSNGLDLTLSLISRRPRVPLVFEIIQQAAGNLACIVIVEGEIQRQFYGRFVGGV